MKKVAMVVSLILGMILITGCFNSGDKVLCTITIKNGIYDVTEKATATIKKDKVTYLKFNAVSDLSKFSENDKKNYMLVVKNSYAKYESDAISSITEMKDNKVIVDSSIDLTIVNESDLKNYSTDYIQFLNNNFTVETYKKAMSKLNYKCS